MYICYPLTQLLYPVLPGLLDSNPFSEKGQVQIPNEVASVLDIFTKTLNLIKDFRTHPEISIQLFTYLFFFVNAFLFNLLMERGKTLLLIFLFWNKIMHLIVSKDI